MKKDSLKSLTRREPRQYEVATIAIYLIGGGTRAVDTEDAAVRCHELAPSLFSWQKYKNQINLELVRVSLSDAKKPKNGGLLSGSGREGWRLSSKGLDWVRNAGQKLIGSEGQQLKRGQSKAGSIDAVRRERERNRLVACDAWRTWSDSRAITPRAAREVFRIDEYTTGKMLEIKITRLRSMFEHDGELSRFLSEASEKATKGALNE
jgi:hypothetical protein